LRAQGHQVRLIPAQFVKPYRKSNKNDFIDATLHQSVAHAVHVLPIESLRVLICTERMFCLVTLRRLLRHARR
jgi:hypothetical protein